jgi:hypothetical protein
MIEARFWPSKVSDAEHKLIQEAMESEGACDDDAVRAENLKGLAEFERAMKTACERFFNSDPVDPGEDGNGG